MSPNARPIPGNRTAHAGDSEGGSSESPIVDPVAGHVIALDPFGDVGTHPCLKSGKAMSKIRSDDGTRLNCVSH